MVNFIIKNKDHSKDIDIQDVDFFFIDEIKKRVGSLLDPFREELFNYDGYVNVIIDAKAMDVSLEFENIPEYLQNKIREDID